MLTANWRTATIRTRVAVMATVLAGVTLTIVAGIQLSTASTTFSELVNNQAGTLARQIAAVAPASERTLVSAIPYTDRGLDGLALFGRDGRLRSAGGGLASTASRQGGLASAARREDRAIQRFQDPQGNVTSRILPWGDRELVEITAVPYSGGSLVLVYHTEWAAERLRESAVKSLLGLAGGALFILFGLLLMLGRLVTWPLGRLAEEVRHLGEGNLSMRLSEQASPELRQLASDITAMGEDLKEAMRTSTTDPLTGLANHRAFHEQLDAAVGNARSTDGALAVIAIDLDNFKAINDQFGHVIGDRVLEAVAAAIAGACRQGDLCARVGGDEFFVICPGLGANAASSVAARIVDAVRNAPVALGARALDGLAVSVSVGVCDIAHGAGTKEELVQGADAALYQAKARGRDRVDVFSTDTASLLAVADGREGARDRLEAAAVALALAVDAKDSGTRSHCDTVAHYAGAIGERLGLAQEHVARLRRAALLHDVGKIATPDAILQKPRPLTPDERQVMEQHPLLGARLMLSAGLPADEADWVRHHHERIDGGGYPDGLARDEIPLESRILLVADAFEAMTSDRVYRAALGFDDAIAELRRGSGSQFDASVVDTFVGLLEAQEALPQEVQSS